MLINVTVTYTIDARLATTDSAETVTERNTPITSKERKNSNRLLAIGKRADARTGVTLGNFPLVRTL